MLAHYGVRSSEGAMVKFGGDGREHMVAKMKFGELSMDIGICRLSYGGVGLGV